MFGGVSSPPAVNPQPVKTKVLLNRLAINASFSVRRDTLARDRLVSMNLSRLEVFGSG